MTTQESPFRCQILVTVVITETWMILEAFLSLTIREIIATEVQLLLKSRSFILWTPQRESSIDKMAQVEMAT